MSDLYTVVEVPEEEILEIESLDLQLVGDTVQYEVLSVSDQGPPGPQGPQGIQGVSGGSSIQATATSPIGGHRLVLTDTSGDVVYADCTVLSHAQMVSGMTSGAASTGGTLSIIRFGELEEPSWSWTLGQPVYLGTNGIPTQTLPMGAAFSLIVGFPITATKLFAAIREPIILS